MGRYGTTRRHIAEGAIAPGKLHAALRDNSYLYEPFNTQIQATDVDGFSAPTGATGDLNFLHTKKASHLYAIKGAGQTLVAPQIDATNGGLLAGLDVVAAEGVEYVPGSMQTNKNPLSLTIGTNPDSFIKLVARLGTVANGAEVAVGWRKAEAQQALIDDYDEAAFLNVQAGNVFTETILNNAATVSADTIINAVNAVNFTLEVRTKGRYVEFYVNGVRKQPAAAQFRFDAGEILVPFIHFLQGAGGTTLHFVSLEIGRMPDVYDSLVSN
jgi:hypothetical protein